MAKTNYTISTVPGRNALSPRAEPYWKQIVPGQSIGYRKTKTGGRWIARYTNPPGTIGANGKRQTYQYKALDKKLGKDPTYIQAHTAAQDFCRSLSDGTNKDYNLQNAVDDYVAHRKTLKGPAAAHKSRKNLENHLPASLLRVRIADLKTDQLKKWRDSLVNQGDSETIRKSKATANRVWADVKAVLNLAFKTGKVNIDTAWRRIEKFHNVDSARKIFLSAKQVNRLREVTTGAFHNLIEAGLQTGARVGELTVLLTEDFDPVNGTITMHTGKTGGRIVFLNNEAVRVFKRIAKGKLPKALLLPKDDGSQWLKNNHQVPMQEAVKAARLARETVFYSLRHTHISRALEAGVNIQVLAENCGTSIKMIESNYGKFTKQTRRNMMNAVSI